MERRLLAAELSFATVAAASGQFWFWHHAGGISLISFRCWWGLVWKTKTSCGGSVGERRVCVDVSATAGDEMEEPAS